MRPFAYLSAETPKSAIAASTAETQFLAGGTTLIDLMKLEVMQPTRLIDINPLHARFGRIEKTAEGLRLGALVRMGEAADDPFLRGDYPVLAQALQSAASAQLRNMATLGGNVLQRTRCNYFRDPSYRACNKRAPGSGCAAIAGLNRKHAVLGVSERCIATYAGDFAQALIALDASVDVTGPNGERRLPFDQLHRLPAESPHLETTLVPGELITAFSVPSGPWTRRSLYLKIRDRESYAFALASAAVALDVQNGEVEDARIGLGGVATVPWRAREAEQILKGKALTQATAQAAAEAAFARAQSREHNAYKPELGRRTLVRALMTAAALEI